MTMSHTRPATLDLASPPMVDIVVASAQRHPGQWTILALQADTSMGKPYLTRGLDVYFRNEHTPGTADILLRWPDSARLPRQR